VSTVVCKGLAEFRRVFKRDMLKKAKELQKAVHATAKDGLEYIDNNTLPIAFGELRKSGHVETTAASAKIVFDAPHAAAVENGSRPHCPPLAPLLRWVKHRGMQGLAAYKDPGARYGNFRRMGLHGKGIARVKRLPGTTTAHHALNIAAQINAMESKGEVPVDAAMQIARAIQMAIKARGTKPHFYARRAIPWIRDRLHARLQAVFHKST